MAPIIENITSTTDMNLPNTSHQENEFTITLRPESGDASSSSDRPAYNIHGVRQPNEETIDTICDATTGKNVVFFSSSEELIEELLSD